MVKGLSQYKYAARTGVLIHWRSWRVLRVTGLGLNNRLI
jgi:hypothetical protein